MGVDTTTQPNYGSTKMDMPMPRSDTDDFFENTSTQQSSAEKEATGCAAPFFATALWLSAVVSLVVVVAQWNEMSYRRAMTEPVLVCGGVCLVVYVC